MEVGTIEIKPKREEHALALARITADWPVNDVLSRFPAAGSIFLQEGSMMRAVTGQIYPDYPPLTVAAYAALNGRKAPQSSECGGRRARGHPGGIR